MNSIYVFVKLCNKQPNVHRLACTVILLTCLAAAYQCYINIPLIAISFVCMSNKNLTMSISLSR